MGDVERALPMRLDNSLHPTEPENNLAVEFARLVQAAISARIILENAQKLSFKGNNAAAAHVALLQSTIASAIDVLNQVLPEV